MEDNSCFFSQREHEKSSWYRFSKEYRNAGWHWSLKKVSPVKDRETRMGALFKVLPAPVKYDPFDSNFCDVCWRFLINFALSGKIFCGSRSLSSRATWSTTFRTSFVNFVRCVDQEYWYLPINFWWKIILLHVYCFSLCSASSLDFQENTKSAIGTALETQSNQLFLWNNKVVWRLNGTSTSRSYKPSSSGYTFYTSVSKKDAKLPSFDLVRVRSCRARIWSIPIPGTNISTIPTSSDIATTPIFF